MTLLAIDPGPTHSAFVHLCGNELINFGKRLNEDVRRLVRTAGYSRLAIEMIASYGMPVGAEVFQTCVEIGRLVELATAPVTLVYRKDVKLALCHSPRANDATIRQALIDKYGGKERAIGKKKAPGPLYGIKSDCWSALAIAVTVANVPCATQEAV